MRNPLRLLVIVITAAFFVTHARSLPQALEDIDSFNFGMGVESFDVTRHQPHPPGYPVYVALTKMTTTVAGTVVPGWDRDRRTAVGIAVWSLIGGTAAIYLLTRFWTLVGLSAGLSLAAAILAVVFPLFWITSVRPLTDMPGLAAAILVQVALLTGLAELDRGSVQERARLSGALVWGAIGVGLLPGLRSQALLLTAPLAVVAIVKLIRSGQLRSATTMVGVIAAGGLAWAIPLVWLSGGPTAYLRALGSQGGEDFADVQMVATAPTLDLLETALSRTFIVPWLSDDLGRVMCALALIGIAIALWRRRPVLAGLAVAYLPYALFHLAFQDTGTIRYGLPLAVPVGGLAAIALSTGGRWGLWAGTTTLAVAGLWFAQPTLDAYGREPAPLSRAMRDMAAARSAAGPAALEMHHQLWWATRRAVDWYLPDRGGGLLPFPGDREWLRIVDRIRADPGTPVWLVGDLRRSDVMLFDRRARVVRGSYTRSARLQTLLAGNRLEAAQWTEISGPGWMLGRGWALSPEAAGMTRADRREPHRQPAEGWLRRSPAPHRLLIGGRHLGGGSDAVVRLDIDGSALTEFVVGRSASSFARWLELPADALAGGGAYARLTVSVRAADGASPAPEIGLEQFDFAPSSALMWAFGDGWQELEENPANGWLWRWSSDRNTVQVMGNGRPITLRLAGESPMRYFDAAPTISISAGGRELHRFTPTGDFDEVIRVPADAITGLPASIAIDTDRVYIPAERSESADRRRLGLRVLRLELTD